jgi:small subunit ribosomal protein S16
MTVVIRMKRTGRRNRPCYRICVSDKRWPRDGKSIERLGLYDPLAKTPEGQVNFDVERAKHWVSVGAQPSFTVRSLFKRAGVYEGAPQPKQRKRPGRKNKTQTGAARTAAKSARLSGKDARRSARLEARRAAKKAAGDGADAAE